MDAPSSERVLMRGSATATFWADGNRGDQVAERFDFGMICRRMPASLLSAARGKADSLCEAPGDRQGVESESLSR
jgi:hypothetical protein